MSDAGFLEGEATPRRVRRHAHPRGDLTEGPVGKTLLMFTLPTLGANILQSLNGSISAIYVGKFLGENAFAAAGVAIQVSMLVFSSVFGLSMAATIIIGQAMGRRNMHEVRRTAGAVAGTFIVLGFIISALGEWAAPGILRLLSTPPAAFPYAVDFLRISFLGLPPLFLMISLQSALRGVGDAVTPLWSTVLNLVFSIVLNPIFILGLGPFPKMGLAGAALAGVVTNIVCLTFIVVRIYWADLHIRLRGDELRLLRPDWAHLKPVLVIGVPMGASMWVMSASMFVMTGLINREGVDTVAAYNAINQVFSYIQMPAFAVGSAVSAMAAQNIGAGRWDRIGLIARTGVMANCAITGVLVAAVLLAGRLLLAVFLPHGSAAIDIGQHINLMIGWTFIPMGISMVMTSIVRANGAVLVPFLILVISVLVVRMTVGFALYATYRADAIWWSFMASGSASALMGVGYYLQGGWRKSAHAISSRAAVPAE